MQAFTVEAIMAAAREQAGLQDFGDSYFIEPFERLLEGLRTEADLNSSGRLTLTQLYTQLLVNRLRFSADLKQHPEILDQVLAAPIIVIGLPRSGTTKLHRVLAAHPDTRFLPLWQVLNPAPFPAGPDVVEDPRIDYARAMIAAMQENFPATLAGHPMDAMAAEEEEQYLMEMTFDGPLVPVRARLPSFTEWRWQRPMTHCYTYLRQLLQYIQWQAAPEASGVKPFVLKSPLHLGHLDALLQVFPGATIVHCHRDPVESVPSFARLVEVGWEMVSDRHDLAEFGRASMQLLSTHMDRYLEQRPTLETTGHFLDVSFNTIVDDVMGVAANCFDRHGLPFNAEVEARIRQWEAANPAPVHGQHSYSLARYGLSETAIRKTFAGYYARFFEKNIDS